jgi:hypothetical protein
MAADSRHVETAAPPLKLPNTSNASNGAAQDGAVPPRRESYHKTRAAESGN